MTDAQAVYDKLRAEITTGTHCRYTPTDRTWRVWNA